MIWNNYCCKIISKVRDVRSSMMFLYRIVKEIRHCTRVSFGGSPTMLLNANSRCPRWNYRPERNNAIMEWRGRNNKKKNGWFLPAYLMALAFR